MLCKDHSVETLPKHTSILGNREYMNNVCQHIDEKSLAPIVLFVFNRLEHTQVTIDALNKNHGAKDSVLYIYSDAPRSDADKPKVKQLRDYLRRIVGFKKVEIIEQERNLGLAKSILLGVTQTVQKYGRVIVLEDDIMTSPYFLKYMNDALELYQNDKKVYSVHGYMFPVAGKLPETFFLSGANSWGWATWKRAWEQFEGDGRKLLNELQTNRWTHQFDVNGTCKYTKMLSDQIAGNNDSWAIRWRAKVFLQGGLTLFPGVSLVQNIGHDSTGVHCQISNTYVVKLSNDAVNVSRIEILENDVAVAALMKFYKSNETGIFQKIVNRLRRICKRVFEFT
jgi:hypothetical protein